MLRTPHLLEREIAIEGDDDDAYLCELPDGRAHADPVLDILGALDAAREPIQLVDVGANLGLHALGFAARGPHVQVLALEANPRTAQWLQHNVDRNGLDQVHVVPRAAGERAGTLPFYDNQRFAAGSTMLLGAAPEYVAFLRAESNAAREVIEVPVVTLDELVDEVELRRVDVVKVDVEGHDVRVVRGAERTIERFRPVVIVEFATLAITLHAGMLPGDVLREVRSRFADVYVLAEGGHVRPLRTELDVVLFLQDNATATPVQDLVCVPDGCALADAVARRVTDAPFPPTARQRLEETERRLAEMEDRLAEERTERQRLAEELAEVKARSEELTRTVSWRVTRPLRAVRGRWR